MQRTVYSQAEVQEIWGRMSPRFCIFDKSGDVSDSGPRTSLREQDSSNKIEVSYSINTIIFV